ncbi:hypothetical protein COI44_23780, partial [Bacillus sp. AFS088145]
MRFAGCGFGSSLGDGVLEEVAQGACRDHFLDGFAAAHELAAAQALLRLGHVAGHLGAELAGKAEGRLAGLGRHHVVVDERCMLAPHAGVDGRLALARRVHEA